MPLQPELGAPSEGPPRGFLSSGSLTFALLGPPTLQLVRFLGKVALAWFLTTEQLGSATLASLLGLLAQMVALFGLDGVLIALPEVERGLWLRLRRFQRWSGLVVAVLLSATAVLIGRIASDPQLAWLTLAFVPNVWIANLSVLPSSLLLRHGRFREVLAADLAGVSGFTLATLVSAALGAGGWSLVAGWYANSLLVLAVVQMYVRPYLPVEAKGLPSSASLSMGAHLCSAGVLGLAAERADGFAVGLGLGRAALGLYEWAQHLSQFAFQYASGLAERFLFPWFSERLRSRELAAAYGESLRLTVTYLVPFQVTLSCLARPLIRSLFPPEWYAAGPLLTLFSLAAAARSIEVVAAAAIKAAGRSRTVLGLSLFRLGCMLPALALALPRGMSAVAIAALCIHVSSAALALFLCARMSELGDTGEPRSARGVRCVLVWCLGFLPLGLFLSRAERSPASSLWLGIAAALFLWLVVRFFLDRPALLRERQLVWQQLGVLRGGLAR